MNFPRRDNEDMTDPPALLFRVTDRLRLEGCVTAMVQDGMSLALISKHESTLDHYGKLLVHRLRAAAPDIALEVYFPASVEALLARFNDALRDHTVEGAMQGSVQNATPRIWILHDASALPAHEIELLARLVAHFPGANIRVMLLLTVDSNKQQLLNPFARRFLRWEIEPPTPEQAEAMLNQARSQGREGQVLSLLQSTPETPAAAMVPTDPTAVATPTTQAANVLLQPTQTPIPLRVLLKKYGRMATVVAALLLASTGAAYLLHTTSWLKAAGQTAAAPSDVPVPASPTASATAAVPAEPAAVGADAAANVQTAVDPRNAVEEVIGHSPQGLSGTTWLQQQSADDYIVQHTTEPSYQAAAQWVKKNKKLEYTQIIPMYLGDNSALEFAVVSGPFSSLRKARKFTKKTDSAKDSQTYTVDFLIEKSAAKITPASITKRTEDTR